MVKANPSRWLAFAFALSALGASACTGEIGGDDGEDGPPGITQGFEPPAPTMRRLLARQYLNAVGDLLGDEARAAAAAPDDQPLNGFDSIGASQLNVGDAGVVDYERSSRLAAAAALQSKAKIPEYLSCTPAGFDDDACLESFARSFARMAFRRPVTEDEIADLMVVGKAAATAYESFDAGLEYVIATALQSPSFVYQIEVGDGPLDETRSLTGIEMATKLSFFLLDTTPSAELLDRAEAGDLDDDVGVRAIAEEMVASPKAHAAVEAMYDEILNLRALATTTKSGDLYPEFSPELAASMRAETLALLDDVVWDRDADFSELFTSGSTFVDANLAALYGVEAPAEGTMAKVELPAGQPRAGFFGQASFLTMQSHVELTSPTLRGKFIRERILCQAISPPPNNVNTTFPENSGAKTMREKLEIHQENVACAGCHALMDPLGLSFENFDAIGRYREQENGVTIDASGDFDQEGHFANGAELAELVTQDEGFIDCVVRNVYRSALGRIEGDGEEVVVQDLVGAFGDDRHRLKALLVELASSDAFRFVGGEK